MNDEEFTRIALKYSDSIFRIAFNYSRNRSDSDDIGSTAIKGIWAKPTIDILVEIPREEKVVNLKGTIERCGYICMAENDNRIAFNKGYTLQGFAERVFHLPNNLRNNTYIRLFCILKEAP